MAAPSPDANVMTSNTAGVATPASLRISSATAEAHIHP